MRNISIKLSAEEYYLVQEARNLLRRKGLDAVDISTDEMRSFGCTKLTLGGTIGICAYLLIRRINAPDGVNQRSVARECE